MPTDTRTSQKSIRNRLAVDTQSELENYADDPTTLTYKGESFGYDALSTRPIDNVNTFSAPGKGVGTWTKSTSFRQNVTRFGIKGGSSPSTLQIAANTTALQSAINSGERLFIPQNGLVMDGTITSSNVPVDIKGSVRNSVIRQMSDTDLLVINNLDGINMPVISGLRLEAAGAFSSAVALTVKGFPTQPTQDYISNRPSGILEKLEIIGQGLNTAGDGGATKWNKGILVDSPISSVYRDIFTQGRSGSSADGSVGLEFTASRSATVNVLDNVTANNYGKGFYAHSTVGLGLEGFSLLFCHWVSCYDGIHIDAIGPGWTILGGHSACQHKNIKINNARQGRILGHHFYNSGNNNGEYGAYIEASLTGDWFVSDCEMVYQEAGHTTDPYGILISGSSTNVTVDWDIHHNYITLKPSGNKPGIWLQSFAQNNRVRSNNVYGANVTVLTSLPENIVYDNYPSDPSDGYQQIVLTTASTGGTDKAIDLTWARADYVVLDATQTGNVTEIIMPFGREFTIKTDGVVTIKHDLNKIRCAGNTDYLTSANTQIKFKKTAQRIEMTGNLTPNPVVYTLPAATTSTIGGTKLPASQQVTASLTADSSFPIDFTLGPVVRAVNTGTFIMTIVLPISPQIGFYHVNRLDQFQTGTMVLTTGSPTTNKVQDGTGTYQQSVNIPTTTNQRQLRLYYNGVHYDFMGF